MKWTQVPAGDLNAAEQRLRVAFGDNADQIVNRINADPAFVDRLATFATAGGFTPTTSQERARAIMGTNMLGIEEAAKHLGLTPSPEIIKALAEVPFTEGELEACKNTHLLVANLGTSIIEIRRLVAGKGKVFYGQDWYNNQKFASQPGKVGWELIRKTPVDNSIGKTYSEQQALLAENEYTPTAQTVIYTMVLYFLATGKRLFESVYVRCSDLTSGGYRVDVGDFDADGLYVDRWDDNRDDRIGLSAAQKFEA
ncbi:MAG: hypothetical protein PHN36_02735 [Patescibacteria group bacterium]|nr:hypothetical protein [Patescibacteria group bacterium]